MLNLCCRFDIFFLSILQFIKTAKHEVPETIQYGRLLKELGKVVKNYVEIMVTRSHGCT